MIIMDKQNLKVSFWKYRVSSVAYVEPRFYIFSGQRKLS